MKTLLITGISGFIGRNLKEYLLDKGYLVLAPTHVELDLNIENDVARYLNNYHADVIIHCASYDHPFCLMTNLMMFMNVVRHSHGKFIYFGSGAEFGREHWVENMPEDYFGEYLPTDQYGLSKFIMNTMSLPCDDWVNLRLFGVYGKYEDYKRRFISKCCVNFLNDQPIEIISNKKYDYLYIDDLCRITEWFVEHSCNHHTYNVCTSQANSLYTIACKVADTAGKDNNLIHIYSDSDIVYSGDNSRLLDECQFTFTPIEEGIKKLYDYYRKVKV